MKKGTHLFNKLKGVSKAGIVCFPEVYRWSSCRYRMGNGEDGLLDIDPCYLGLGETPHQRSQAYRKLLADETDKKMLAVIQNGVRRNQLTGSRKFVDEIEQRVGFRIEHRGRGRPGKSVK